MAKPRKPAAKQTKTKKGLSVKDLGPRERLAEKVKGGQVVPLIKHRPF